MRKNIDFASYGRKFFFQRRAKSDNLFLFGLVFGDSKALLFQIRAFQRKHITDTKPRFKTDLADKSVFIGEALNNMGKHIIVNKVCSDELTLPKK